MLESPNNLKKPEVDVARTLLLLYIMFALCSCDNHSGSMSLLTPNALAARPNAAEGLRYLHQGYIDRAQEQLHLALDQSPKDPLILDANGYLYETMGQIELANSYYLQAIVLAPESGTIRNNYGAFLCRNGYYSLSIPYFITAAELPHYAESQKALGNARFCNDLIKTKLGGSDEYAYYTKQLWEQPIR